MLERRSRLKQAEESLNGLFNNRRINASAAPAVIGLLPSAGAMTICAEIVRSSCGDYLSNEDMTAVTSFYRHIPECFLPTYSSILIALAVSGIGAGEFVVAMLPLVAALFFIGYLFFLRKVPKPTGMVSEGGRKAAAKMLLRSLWSIILIVALIIAFDIPVYIATPLVAVLNVFVDRLKPWEIKPMFRTAFEPVIIFNTVLIMMFKDIITSTGVIHELPVFFWRPAHSNAPGVCADFLFWDHHQRFQCNHSPVYAHGHGSHAGGRRPAPGAAHEFRLCGHADKPYPCMPVYCSRVF